MTNYIAAFRLPSNHYHHEAVRLADTLRDRAHAAVDAATGIIRWISNGQVVPADVAAFAAHLGLGIDEAACTAARSTELRSFLASYREARAGGPSAEEKLEARAAMGPGVDMVDIITGHRFRT